MRLSCAPFYLGKDLSRIIRGNRGHFILCCAFALIGAGLGIYFARIAVPSEPPFGIFASLFADGYTPFIWIKSFFLHFALYLLLGSLGFLLSAPYIPVLACDLLFGKFVAETAAICFLTDGSLFSLLSLLIVYTPIFFLGTLLFFLLLLKLDDLCICRGNSASRKLLLELVGFLLKVLLAMLLWCVLVFVGICGVIYIVIIAV